MHTTCPTSHYDLSTRNHLGMLAVLMVANLFFAMLYFVRIPIEFDFRQVIIQLRIEAVLRDRLHGCGLQGLG